ncbi:MAG: nickel-dependent lactate racemase [Ignavibacteriae bacterium]|nr:nickel-dependent lactate racemase [Ignavibacteriota bacterium]
MIELRFGTAVQQARPPAGWRLQRLRIAPPRGERSEAAVVTAALDAAQDDLAVFLEGAGGVTVLISDHTRLCRSEVFLPALLARVHAAGVPVDATTLLFACGTHRRQSEAEQRAILGDGIFARYRVADHDCRDGQSMVEVGRTRYGTRVSVNRIAAEAERIIATGTVVHHYFAGYGGGAKLFVPGVAAYDTAVQNHRRTLTADARFHTACRDGSFEGNPVADDIMDTLRFMPPSRAFTALLGPDGRIIDALCGGVAEVHAAARARVDALYRTTVSEYSDITITSCGGAPKDVNFIQSHKTLHRASYITKPGGSIICLAACSEGIGNTSFLPWFDVPHERLAEAIDAGYTMNAHTAVAMRDKAERFRVYLVSTLPHGEVRRMGMTPCETLQEALDQAAATLPADASAYLVENGSLLVPSVEIPDA